MPIFEYKCKSCGKKFDFLQKSQNDKPVCACGSHDLEKQFSSFAVSDPSPSAHSCADGSCGLRSPCASGACPLS